MNLLVTLVLVYNVVRLLGGSIQIFKFIYATLNASTTAYLIHDDTESLPLFAVLVVGAALSECLVLVPPDTKRLHRSRPMYLGYACATFSVGWIIWRLSDTAGPWCVPNGLWQGHSAWHLLTSLSILLLCVYFRSECHRFRIRVSTRECGLGQVESVAAPPTAPGSWVSTAQSTQWP
jgi:hypothetical protein